MAALDLSNSQPPSASPDQLFTKDADNVVTAATIIEDTTDAISTSNTVSGISIGARIMRQFRRKSQSLRSSDDSGRIDKSSTDITKKKNMNSKAIEKLYLNKSLGRLKHTQLETIFEHEHETDANENYTLEPTKVFGKRKIKRSMSCSDGFNASKTLKQKRKNRIRKIFGVHKKIKSISMKKFLEHLQVGESIDLITSAPLALTAITNGA